MSLYWPLGVFAIAALGGVVMAVRVLGGKAPPWALSLLHAALGATGIVLLFIALQSTRGAVLVVTLALFVAAALGGFFLASFHLRGKPHPRVGLIVHPVVAVTAFVLLAGAALGVF